VRVAAWTIAVGILLVLVEVPGEETFSKQKQKQIRSRERVRVELTDGTTIEGQRIELGRGVVVLDSRRLKTERIVRWDRIVEKPETGPRPPATGDLVLLVGGDRLSCKVQSIDLEHLVAGWDGLGRPGVFRIPLERIRAVLFGSGVPDRLRRRLKSGGKVRSGDELWLRGGDRLVGELKSLGSEAVVLATEAGNRRVARKSVAALLVNPELQVKARRRTRHVRVAFADGSRLTSAWPTSQRDGLIGLVLSGIGSNTDESARVEALSNTIRSVQYFGVGMLRLTRLKPTRVVHTPFLGAVRAPVVDGSIGGGPLEVAGLWSANGLGMTSRTRMTWDLDGLHRFFCARVAIDDTAGGGGDVVFGVLLDGRSVWSSGPVRGQERLRAVGPLDLSGARTLTLVVDYGRRADVKDHAVWLDPRLVKEQAE
jgi:hypothetical protein